MHVHMQANPVRSPADLSDSMMFDVPAFPSIAEPDTQIAASGPVGMSMVTL